MFSPIFYSEENSNSTLYLFLQEKKKMKKIFPLVVVGVAFEQISLQVLCGDCIPRYLVKLLEGMGGEKFLFLSAVVMLAPYDMSMKFLGFIESITGSVYP